MKDRPRTWYGLVVIAGLAVAGKFWLHDSGLLVGVVVIGQLALCSLLLVTRPAAPRGA